MYHGGRPLTELQRRVLDAVVERVEADGVAPTLAEIGQAIGGVSPQAVRPHVVALARKGYLRYDHHIPRSIRLLRRAGSGRVGEPELHLLPILGIVAAGSPIERLDLHPEQIWVEASLARSSDSYVLRVRGNSMVGDGILDGDLVVVQPAEDAENGQTVVALLADGSVTLKRLYRERGYVRLQPANPQLEPIVVPSVQVQGRVVAVIRHLPG